MASLAAEGVAAIYDPQVAHGTASFETEPPGADEMARRIAYHRERRPSTWGCTEEKLQLAAKLRELLDLHNHVLKTYLGSEKFIFGDALKPYVKNGEVQFEILICSVLFYPRFEH